MPDGDGESITSKIQEAEARADDIIEDARHRLADLRGLQATPLIEYEATINELAEDIEQATDGLRLGTEELEIVRQRRRILNRIDIAINAQLTARQRAVEQQLEYVEDWIEDLRTFAVEISDGTTPLEDHESKLTSLSDWMQKARQYVDADRHAELAADDGAYTLADLTTRIEDAQSSFRSAATGEAEREYFQNLCRSEIDHLERVIDRLERVVPTNETYSTQGFESDLQAASSVESLTELVSEIRTQREAATQTADTATETAMTLDALEEAGFDHQQMEDLHANAMENLAQGDIETARRQTGKLLKWETELDPIDRFEITLSEHDGALLRVVEQSGFSIEEALDHVSELYHREKIDDITVHLK